MKLQRSLEELDYKTNISNNAGNYLCNNIYYHCLKKIKDNDLKTKCIFLHIPTSEAENDFDLSIFSKDLLKLIKKVPTSSED